MNKRTQAILAEIETSGESAAIAVVDHIRTVASNGREYATIEAVTSEAENLAQWAQVVKARLNPQVTEKSTSPKDSPEFRVIAELVRLIDAGIRPQIVKGMRREEDDFFACVLSARVLLDKHKSEHNENSSPLPTGPTGISAGKGR